MHTDRVLQIFIYLFYFIYLFESGNMAHKKHEHDRQGQKMNDKNTNIKEHTKDTHTHRNIFPPILLFRQVVFHSSLR